jgi:quercetin dioxygenase-like cupin family protein
MEAKIILTGDGQNLNVLGDNQFIKLTGDDTGGAYVLVEQVNAVGTGIPLHVHNNEEETFFIIEGKYEFTVKGESVMAPAGTTVHLPRGVEHSFKVTEGAPARALIWLCPAGSEKMFTELSTLPAPPDMAQVLSICAKYGVVFL